MAHQKCNDFQVQARALLAVRHGRELGEQVAAMRDAPIGDLPRTSLSATLRRLATGEVTDGRDIVVFEALQNGLAARMSLEIVGSWTELRRVGYDEDGELWAPVEVTAYSDRGDEARAVHDRLERFLELRQQLLDQATAERLARQLLR